MQQVIRFHLDEDVNHAIATGLRNRDIDVTTPADANLLAATDEEQLAYALEEGRVLFTHDVDHLRHAATGVEHAGIVFCRQSSRSVGHIITSLILIYECLTAAELKGMVEYI